MTVVVTEPPTEPTQTPAALTEAEIRADQAEQTRRECAAEWEQSEQWRELMNLREQNSAQGEAILTHQATISNLEARLSELEATPPVEAEAEPEGEVTPLEVETEIDREPEEEREAERPKRKPGLW